MAEKKIINKRILIKLLITVLIMIVVVGIYIYKNEKESKDTSKEIIPLEIASVNLEEIKVYGVPFVIDFGSDSCVPCKEMAPVLETLHGEFQGKAIIHLPF